LRRALRMIEAAYEWHPTEVEWLAGVTRTAGAYDVGGGVVSYTVDLRQRPRVISQVSSSGTPDGPGAALKALTESFSTRLGRAAYVPTEFAGNATYRLSEVAKSRHATLQDLEQSAGCALPPTWALVSGDPRRRVAVLGLLAKGRIAPSEPFPSRRMSKELGLVGAHLGAALRLRAAAAPRADDDATEAVLAPNGRVLHATGAAVHKRQSLAEAVVAMDRARLRRVPEDEALRLWNALVDGRWSIVEVVERDGKRLLLARPNGIDASPDLLSLTELERDVAWLISMGHSYKYIAYELGISPSMVVRRLSTAMQKLRIRSRHDLIRIFAAE
jgi:DNA-binding CsgD family transcriptional regulator